MFQAAGGCGKLKRVTGIITGVQAIDQPAAEAVSPAYAVYDVGQVIAAAQQELLAVIAAGLPDIAVSGDGLAQGDGDMLQVGVAAHSLPGNLAVEFGVDVTMLGASLFGLDAQAHLKIFLIGNGAVYKGHQAAHHLGSLFAVFPQVLAEV